MKTIKITLFSAVLLSIVALTGCSDDNGDSNPTAPQLPPQESMSANMGGFPSNGESSSTFESQTQANFGFAASNVVFWQTLLKVQLAIPVAAFNEAFNHSFEYLRAEGRWRSEYDVQVGSQNITATLYAERDNGQVHWKMYLSADGQFEDFLWFQGESQVDNSGGTWVLYKSPSESREVLRIDWDRVNGTAVNPSYTLTDNQNEKQGSYIEYGLTDEAGFTHFYEVSITSSIEDDYDVFIYYNQDSKEGSVRSEAHFGDNTFRCWDSNFDDTSCED